MAKHAHQFQLKKHPFPNVGDFFALMTKDGRKPSNVHVVKSLDKLFPQATLEECNKIYEWLVRYMLMNHDLEPEERRELLSHFDSCPCCEHWLGHNNPPPDDDDPQSSFGFGR